MTRGAIGSALGFQLVWLACALGAASGVAWPGVVAAVCYAGWQLAVSARPGALGLMILCCCFVGVALETGLAASGLLRFSAPWPNPSLAPAWMLALWLAFGASLPALSALLERLPRIGHGALGAVGGPLAYVAGSNLGALSFGEPRWLVILALSLAWGLLMPAGTALWSRMARP